MNSVGSYTEVVILMQEEMCARHYRVNNDLIGGNFILGYLVSIAKHWIAFHLNGRI